jgi:hypothetical protein
MPPFISLKTTPLYFRGVAGFSPSSNSKRQPSCKKVSRAMRGKKVASR